MEFYLKEISNALNMIAFSLMIYLGDNSNKLYYICAILISLKVILMEFSKIKLSNKD